MKKLNLFEEINNSHFLLEKIRLLQNKCLDSYKDNPSKYSFVLKELNSLSKEIESFILEIETLLEYKNE
jgi:hypothetical protein